MAEWSRNKVDSSQLNNGNEFDNNSSLALDEINAVVNGGLYSQDFTEHLADTPDTSEAGNVGIPAVSLVDNIVGDKTFKKFKFSNLKGQKGEKGLEYLTVKRAFESRYPVGNIAVYYLNDFNRTPVVNDIFSTLCADKYYTTFKIINTETKQMQSIAEVDIKGEKGDTGENYLTINATARFPKPPEINMIIFVSILYFNRPPLVNDILLFVYRDVTTNRSWLVNGRIDRVSQIEADIEITSFTETTGEKGDTGLIRNNFLTQTIIPVISTVYNFNQQSNFSRIPVVGETFLGVWKQSQDNRSWLFTAEVTSSSEESVLAKVVSLSETTASIDNAVDLVSNQTVGGEKTFTDDVYFKSDDGADKKIEFVDENNDLLFRMRGSVPSKALVLNSTSYYIRNRNNGNTGVLINPDEYMRPEKDNGFDLGTSGNRLKDVYVAGNLSDGTNSISIADIVNGLAGIETLSSQLSSLSTRMTAAENKLAEPQKTVIFDMDSSDANLNMGFENGMLPDHSIERSDLASFKYFKFYLVSGDSESVLTVNLPNSDDPASFAVNHTFAQNSRGFLTVFIEFSADLSTITFTDMVYILYAGNSGTPATIVWYDTTLSSHGHIRKIEAFA